MGSKTRGVRLSDEVNAWVDEYAESRGVEASAILRTAIESFKEDCERGVPELRQLAAHQAAARAGGLAGLQGVGNCPKRPGELGHIWQAPRVDPLRSCVHCGLHGREPAENFDGNGVKPDQGGGFLREFTAERGEMFVDVKAPMQSGTGSAEKAWSRDSPQPPAQAAKAAEIVADKKRRDAEAVASGTARPGQVAGAKGARS